MPIELSPLSSRTEDIPLLINYFKNKLSELNGVQQPNIDIKNDNLYTYSWPGNVRELRNLIERITILSSNESKQKINQVINDILNPSSKIDNKDLLEQSFQSPLKEAREHFEKEYLTTQLKNITETFQNCRLYRNGKISLAQKIKIIRYQRNKLR